MPTNTIATREQWLQASEELLASEKEHTRAADELARRRRELPWVRIDADYTFDTADGPKTLAELFDGRSQLVIYHFMFGPDYEDGGCPVCSSIADSFDGVLHQLNARDVTMTCISRAPIDKLLAYRERMGWSFDWASSFNTEFNYDFDRTKPREEMEEWAKQAPPVVRQFAALCGTDAAGYVSERPGLSVFKLQDGEVYLTYVANSRGLEPIMTYYGILDLVPSGRDGDPGDPAWMRRHDEFEAA
jgi:predicted dithiol-disulfide oxidoreductase (DUF899 family)